MSDSSKGTGSAVGGAIGSVYGPIGTMVGSALGGIVGGLLGGTDHSAEDKMKAIQSLYQQIQNPNFDMSSLTPEQKAVAGVLTPENMQALEMVGPQVLNDNGQGRAAQMSALQSLQQMGQGGLTLQDKSDMASIQNQQGATNKGQQDAIISNMNARGAGGSGQELAARMIAQQGAADTAAQQGTQVAANAQTRALQALQSAGQAGSNLRSQDNSVAAQNANIINQFNQANFANKQGIANQNVANRNSAQGFNLSNAQNISNQNVDTNNQTAQFNLQNQNNLKQQQFGNDLSKVNGQAGAAASAANYMNANAAGQQSKDQGIGSAIGGLVGAGVSAFGGGSSKPSGTTMAGGDDINNKMFQS